jgi:hypothetical protein
MRVAEAAKVVENIQRDVNIALVNELALIFDRLGIDTQDVLDAAGSKWNFLPFRPGLVGGHCIGVDPYYLLHKSESVGYHPDLIHTARQVNNRVGEHVASRVLAMLAERGRAPVQSRILVLGVTFKEDCPDLRNSRALELAQRLRDAGAQVEVSDPWVGPAALADEACSGWPNPWQGRYDAVVLAVAHARFKAMDEAVSGRCWRRAAWSTTSNRPGHATWLTIACKPGGGGAVDSQAVATKESHAPVYRLPARHPDVPDLPVAGHDLAGLVLGRRPDCRDGGAGDLGPAAEAQHAAPQLSGDGALPLRPGIDRPGDPPVLRAERPGGRAVLAPAACTDLPARQERDGHGAVRHPAQHLRGGLRVDQPLAGADRHRQARFPRADRRQLCQAVFGERVQYLGDELWLAVGQRDPRTEGARRGGFYHDTGEGSISPYHREMGGDLVWEIGSGYFGCRDEKGGFSEERFVANATHDQVKMIEIKLSQGAKPGHGGVLPAPR